MNRTTTIAVCLAMLMIGFAYVAASSNDSSGEAGTFSDYELDVSGVDNLGTYTFMGTAYKVIKDADKTGYRASDIRADIIVDSAGIKDGDHENCQKQCNKFLHFISLFLNKIDLDLRPVWYGRMIARQSARVKDFLNVYSRFFFVYSLFRRIFTASVNIPSRFCVFAQSDSTACLKD